MRRVGAFLVTFTLAGCAAPQPAPPALAQSAPPPVAVAPPAPPPPKAPPPKAAPPPPPDTCGARSLQYLVGRPRSEIPVPINPGGRRVTCTTCPMTMDFSPGRLNILFDAESGIIKEVKCG